MLLARSFEIAVDGEDTVAVLERALTVLSPSVPIWTYLDGKPDVINRAIKKYPALDKLGPAPTPIADATRIGVTPEIAMARSHLASLPDDDRKEPFSVPIDAATARAVAGDVPRSLSLRLSHFVLGPVSELWLAPGAPRPYTSISTHPDARDHQASVIVKSGWSTPRREISLHVHLVMTPPARELKRLPPLPDATRTMIASLGRVDRETMRLVPDADEAHSRSEEPAALALVEQAKERLRRRAIELPHPDLAADPWHQRGEAFGSFKDELRRVLPRYRYQSKRSRRGVWVLTKQTTANNQLELSVDRGPIGGNARATFWIRGAMWSHHLTLPVSTNNDELCVWNPATLAALCENWAAEIELLEGEFVGEIERLYWPGYAWYSPS